jgi:DGQHR domain-containing protein
MSINMSCVKSRMLDTDFWLGTMTFAGVDRQILPPDDPRWDRIFGGQDAQRKLVRSRVKATMVPYLLNNRDAFFNSLVVVLIPMDGSKLKEGRDYRFIPSAPGSDVGTLEIEDTVMMFIADGQHRREAIAMAVRDRVNLGIERVPVVFLAYEEPGRVRQVFSDLNLNAKPVSKTIGYAFETRDPIVVVTKRVTHDVPLFNGRVNEMSNSLSSRSPYVVTMNTLVACHKEILAAMFSTSVKKVGAVSELEALTHLDPNDGAVASVSDKLAAFWNLVISRFPQWHQVMTSTLKPGEVREGVEGGDPGFIFAYGIGWQAIAMAASSLIRRFPSDWEDKLTECLDLVDWSRENQEWNNVAMVGKRVNNTGPGIRDTADYILRAGGYLPEPATSTAAAAE